ncbi:MAG TPA: phenylalanine--tRNA ligase subunit beta, partial [Candidatus Hydrogenedentes bacterium]|nr:phenylalanine--tRNA ligase subunit beta [Candidatus Hydrogenedentota bacterium]
GFAIGKRKMRSVESQGMMCSARELGLGEDHSGLMILPEDAPLGMDAKEYLGLNDVVVEIEVTPNRGDWACMIGVARELAAYYGKELRVPAVALEEKGGKAAEVSSVRIEDTDACPRYMARILENVKVGPSPLWMAQRLIAAGQRPISNIVDITNYVLLETGHPLHAFDFDLLAENRIVVRTAAPGEAITTLDGMKRALEPDMLVIADAKNPQAVAGVMGGADSEVGDGTTRILLESAVFKPASVRRTARKLGLVTEAAQHFQRGSDPEMARYAIDRAAALMCELAGATVREEVIDEYPTKPASRSIALRTARTDAFLGMAVPAREQRTILERLGCQVEQENADGITVRVPSWRHDLKMETDLIEEIVRFYGYDRVPATIPRVRQSEEVFAPHEKKVSLLRKCLVSRGLSEFYNWTFSSPAAVQRLGLGGYCGEMVLLQNPLSENHAGMRTSLIPGLLANAETNHKRGNARLAAFEIGPVYLPVAGQDLADEPLRLGLLLSGPAGVSHWSAPDRPTDLY